MEAKDKIKNKKIKINNVSLDHKTGYPRRISY